MPNSITRRRQNETSKIFSRLAEKNEAINISINEAINDILNNRFAQSSNLANIRQVNEQRIKEINDNYVRTTQDVLDDKTLDFLIQHSQIDAPTLTSIFAGFELARASKAKKLNEQRQADVQDIEAINKINEQVKLDNQETSDLRIKQLEDTKEDQIRSNREETAVLARAAVADVTASERITETAEEREIRVRERGEDAELQLRLQNIRSAPKVRENDKGTLFKNLRSGTSTQTTGLAPNPLAPNPLAPNPLVNALTPVQQAPQSVTLNQSDDLTDDEILLLNHDRNLTSQSDPTDIFGTQLSSSSTVSSLSEEEQLFLQKVRGSGGAISTIQLLNDTPDNGVNINRSGDLTRAEIDLLSFNRDELNTTDVPSHLIDNESNLDENELTLLQQIRESNVAREEVTGDELTNLIQQRRLRLGEEVPLKSTNINRLELHDLDVVNRSRLDQILQPTINVATSDETLLFNPDVVEQIDLLNQREDIESLDPLEFQQSLVDRDIDVTGLTVAQVNKLFEESL